MKVPRQRLHAERNFTVIQGEGRGPGGQAQARQAAVYYLMLALVAVLVLQMGYHWLGSHLYSRRFRQVAAVPGYLESTVEAGGLVSRREEVIYAPSSGVLAYLSPAGERVLKDGLVARIYPLDRTELQEPQPEENTITGLLEQFLSRIRRLLGRPEGPGPPSAAPVTGEPPPWLGAGEAVTAPHPGLLSFYVDGWEGTAPFTYLSREEFAARYTAPALPQPGTYVEAGRPLFKIVDNWRWHYSVVLPLNPGRTVAARERVTLTFDFAPENPVVGLLEEVTVDGEREAVYLTYRVEQDLAGFSERRWAEAVVSYQRLYGLLVPGEALHAEEGQEPAVFVNQGGMVTLRPVTVLHLKEGQALVEGLSPYSLVITRPDLVREGQRLDF